MKSEYKIIFVITFITFLLSACGSTSVKENNGSSVAEQKTKRAATTAERRVDQHTDHKVNRAVDRLFRKL